MKLSDSLIDEVRSSANIVDVVSEHIELVDKGKEHKGLCPFHSEKTPSFHVSPEKGLFHCFGCGASGNIFTFIMKFHHLDFVEAVKYVAERQGISLEEDEKYTFRKDIASINQYILKMAEHFYGAGDGAFVREYMSERHFDEQICEEFHIGYLPDKLTYRKVFLNFDEEIIKESGLFNYGQYKTYGRFSGRLIIPIHNIYGKVIGFSGRIMKGDGAKYINSPETPLFKKREVLYNMDKAKDSIKTENHAIVVEGYFDVMRLHANGIENSVSPMGTSLTREQVGILKRYADETTLIFDGDVAGKKAAYRALDVFIEINYYPSVVFLPQGEDPDSLVLKKGVEYLKSLIAKRKDLLLFIAEKSRAAADNYNTRITNLSKIKEKLLNIRDPYRKEHYLESVAAIFEVNVEILKKDIEISQSKNILKTEDTNQQDAVIYYCEEEFLSALFNLDEDVVDSLLDGLKEQYFHNKKNIHIYQKVVEIISNNGNIRTLLNDLEIGESLSHMLVKAVSVDDPYMMAVESKNKVILNHLDDLKKQKQNDLARSSSDLRRSAVLVQEISEIVQQQIKIKTQLSED